MSSLSLLSLLSTLRYLRWLAWPVVLVHGLGTLLLRALSWFLVVSIGLLMLGVLLALLWPQSG